MQKYVLFLIALLFLPACGKNFSGTLDVAETIQLNTSNNKELTLTPGSYSTDLTIQKEGNKAGIKAEIKTPGDLFRTTVHFRAPMMNIPSNGSFFIPANKLGQDFDLDGRIETSQNETGPHTALRSCKYDTWDDYRCRGLLPRPDYCDEPFPRGTQWVTYYRVTESTDMGFDLLNRGSDQRAASYSGYSSRSWENVADSGPCRMRH